MRGLSLAGILVGLAVIGYLQINSVERGTERASGVETARDLPGHVETEINAAVEQHMNKLKESPGQ